MIEAVMRFEFATNKQANSFSGFLYRESYEVKTQRQDIIELTVFHHGDRQVVLAEAESRGAQVLKNEVWDSDDEK